MKCPNCGKNVRSKTQCAHCGRIFDNKDVKQGTDEEYSEYDYIEDKPRKKAGFGSILLGILKLITAVAVIFVAFLFGPKIINDVVEYFQPGDSEVVETKPELTESKEETSPEQENSIASESESESQVNLAQSNSGTNEESTSSEETTLKESSDESQSQTSEEETTAEEIPSLKIEKHTVNMDEYPLISVELAFNEELEEVKDDSFKFSLTTNDKTVELDKDYSLVKDKEKLILSFNDPAVNVLRTEPLEQLLQIQSTEFKVDQEFSYELPASSLDTEIADELNTIINDNIAESSNVSAVIYEPESEVPYVYDDQTHDAGSLISWFIIANTYNQVNEGKITLDDVVPLNSDLMAQNDQGTVATAAEEAEFTVQDLVVEIIHNRDVSAMNHLVDLIGGPNEFNLWMNESGYFATRITQLLSIEEGTIVGAVTKAQDVANLLQLLSHNQLISEEMDEIFKQNLLDTPMSDKFPYETLGLAQRRFEMTTNDENPDNQHYSGIIETEKGSYIVVLLVSAFEDAATTVQSIAQSIDHSIRFVETGGTEVEETTEMMEEDIEVTTVAPETTESSQVSFIDEPVVNTGQYEDWQIYQSETGIVYGPDEDGDGFRDTYRNESGNFVPIKWYQGADGNWYFNE